MHFNEVFGLLAIPAFGDANDFTVIQNAQPILFPISVCLEHPQDMPIAHSPRNVLKL